MKRAGGINDNRVNARLRFDESHTALDAEYEHDLGKGLAGQPIVRKNCHALYFAWRFAGRGVDQVMESGAVGVEVTLVVARGRDRDVLERQHRGDLAGTARVANADRPRPAAAVADHPAVAAGAHHRVADAA